MAPERTSPRVREAFRQCQQIARAHYENFPVASLFLPKRLRPSVAAIYAFARIADDVADEGTLAPARRLALLDDWQHQLEECYEGRAAHPVFIALGEVVRAKGIPKNLLADLLTAFKMDVTTHRYKTFGDLLFYCRHSANPVGRLVLLLFDDLHERSALLSDKICTALQLANFWQDLTVDARKGRIYLPLEDMERFGYTEKDLLAGVADSRFVELMKERVVGTRRLFDEGSPLLRETVPVLRFELTLTWNGGATILRKIEEQHYNVFSSRPAITTADKISIFLKSLVHRTV